jgi:predicted HTH domain antitoxin
MTYMGLPAIVEKEINALIQTKYYSSMSDAVKDAFRALFDAKPNLRKTSALQLYINKDISLSKAAEIAGVSIEEFKEILMTEGMKREIEPDKEIDENVKEILERRI